MKLVELLVPDRILVPLKAGTLREAATALTEATIASGAAADPEKLRQLVKGALPKEIVPVGQAFMLHYRSEAVSEHSAALGVAAKPIKASDAEGPKAARIVVLLVAPPRESSAHLQALSAFARALSRQEVIDALLEATGPDDVLDAAPLADLELPGYLTVRDVMQRRRLSVRPEAPLGEASRLMVAHDVTALPVVSETGEVLGVITHRELLRHLLPLYVKRMSSGEFRSAPRGAAANVDPHSIPVREVMDRSVLCVSEEQTLAEVATMMLNRNIERFPVVSEGALVGFLTRGDIVRRLLGR
jgi:CBS domain-containing protein/mannitol/fructose-specific phosphotransferase system IIA component (Ntr-type)